MGEIKINQLQNRTDAKLRYAYVYLEELKTRIPPNGSDADKAHQESFLIHFLGAIDALLKELKYYYPATVPPKGLSFSKRKKSLKKKGVEYPELKILFETIKIALIRKKAEGLELQILNKLNKIIDTWYPQAKVMRNHSAHNQGVLRGYYMSGKVELKDPETGVMTGRHFIDEFEDWHTDLKALTQIFRRSM